MRRRFGEILFYGRFLPSGSKLVQARRPRGAVEGRPTPVTTSVSAAADLVERAPRAPEQGRRSSSRRIRDRSFCLAITSASWPQALPLEHGALRTPNRRLGVPYERVSAENLREVGRTVARARAEREVPRARSLKVLLDVCVVIEPSNAAVGRRLGNESSCDAQGLTYVGTPKGLAGLVADIHWIGVVDGLALSSVPTTPWTAELLGSFLDELDLRGFAVDIV